MNPILIKGYGISIYVDKRKLIIDNKLNLKQSNTGLNRLNNLFKCMLIIKLNIKQISSVN